MFLVTILVVLVPDFQTTIEYSRFLFIRLSVDLKLLFNEMNICIEYGLIFSLENKNELTMSTLKKKEHT